MIHIIKQDIYIYIYIYIYIKQRYSQLVRTHITNVEFIVDIITYIDINKYTYDIMFILMRIIMLRYSQKYYHSYFFSILL